MAKIRFEAEAFALIVLLLVLGALPHIVDAEAGLGAESEIRGHIDLSPPSIVFSPEENITIDADGGRICFAYVVSDVGRGGSEILDTRVFLYRTPRGGDPVQYWGNVSEVGPTADKTYEIPINLTAIHSKGLVKVKEITMEDLVATSINDCMEVEYSGFFDFTTTPVYNQCSYYMIIIAVDKLGNAFWGVYDVTSYVQSLTTNKTGTMKVTAQPSVHPRNVHGKVWRGLLSHYYILNGKTYLPYIRTDSDEYQKCFVMEILPGNSSVSIPTVNVSAENMVYAGFMVLRCDYLWQ